MSVPQADTFDAHADNRRRASYLRVALTFMRNSLVRDMTYRSNFVVNMVAMMAWVGMQLAFYMLIFQYTRKIGGWNEAQFFVFLATGLLINGIMQTFFIPNATEFSELIRTGHLDFALLKPIDTQFLVSCQKIEWSSLALVGVGLGLLGYSVPLLEEGIGFAQVLLYPAYVVCGVAMLYSLMILLSATSVWLTRNQSLQEFWFYITNFSRYPMEIYTGSVGFPIQVTFTWIVPILLVVNVPARVMARPLDPRNWPLALFALLATAASLAVSRAVFQRCVAAYRSASS